MPLGRIPFSIIYVACLVSFISLNQNFSRFIYCISLKKQSPNTLICFNCEAPATLFQKRFCYRRFKTIHLLKKNYTGKKLFHPVAMTNVKTVLVPIIEDCEEIETVTVVDTLVRAGAKVTVASCGEDRTTKMSRGVVMVADVLLEECKNQIFDLIVIPGGSGAKNLSRIPLLISLLRNQRQANRWLAAICAAPALVLQPHGLLDGAMAVAYPNVEHIILDRGVGRVCISDKIVTSIGPGSALEFALTLVEILYGKFVSQKHAKAMCAHPAVCEWIGNP